MSFASPQFELIEESLDDQTHLIAVRGEVHVSTAPEFSERLNDAIAKGMTFRPPVETAKDTLTWWNTPIPAEFWSGLADRGLVVEGTPLPASRAA